MPADVKTADIRTLIEDAYRGLVWWEERHIVDATDATLEAVEWVLDRYGIPTESRYGLVESSLPDAMKWACQRFEWEGACDFPETIRSEMVRAARLFLSTQRTKRLGVGDRVMILLTDPDYGGTFGKVKGVEMEFIRVRRDDGGVAMIPFGRVAQLPYPPREVGTG